MSAPRQKRPSCASLTMLQKCPTTDIERRCLPLVLSNSGPDGRRGIAEPDHRNGNQRRARPADLKGERPSFGLNLDGAVAGGTSGFRGADLRRQQCIALCCVHARLLGKDDPVTAGRNVLYRDDASITALAATL